MRVLLLTKEAFLHLEEWRHGDAKMLFRIVSLLTEIAKNSFEGTGKSGLLKHNLKGSSREELTRNKELFMN